MANMSFSEWVQAELNSRGWDQAELARRSKISDAHISRIVSGGRKPGPDSLNAIARAFRLPPDEVYRHAGLLPPKDANLTPGDKRALIELMDKIATLSPDNQRFVSELVDKVKRSEER